MTTKNDRGGKVGVLGVLATKATKLFKAVKLLKFTKLLVSSGSMALSIFAYSFSMGIYFATGFVGVLFIHEMGHVFAMRLRGYPTRAPVFIPFLGAAIFVPGFRTSDDEAFIGYGGPFLGMLISVLLYYVWLVLPSHPVGVLRLSYVSTFLNLFNMIPVRPLDGGRITQIVGEWFKYIGFAVFVGYVVYSRQVDMLFLVFIFLMEMKLDGRLRLGVGLTLQVVLMAIIFTGHSGESAVGAAITIVAASFLNTMFWFRRDQRSFDSEELEPAPTPVRLGWLAAYVVLGVILWALMSAELPILPPVKF